MCCNWPSSFAFVLSLECALAFALAFNLEQYMLFVGTFDSLTAPKESSSSVPFVSLVVFRSRSRSLYFSRPVSQTVSHLSRPPVSQPSLFHIPESNRQIEIKEISKNNQQPAVATCCGSWNCCPIARSDISLVVLLRRARPSWRPRR